MLNLGITLIKYEKCLEKQIEITQFYDQVTRPNQKKHRFIKDLKEDFQEDLKNFGFARFQFKTKERLDRLKQSKSKLQLEKEEKASMQLFGKSQSIRHRPQTGMTRAETFTEFHNENDNLDIQSEKDKYWRKKKSQVQELKSVRNVQSARTLDIVTDHDYLQSQRGKIVPADSINNPKVENYIKGRLDQNKFQQHQETDPLFNIQYKQAYEEASQLNEALQAQKKMIQKSDFQDTNESLRLMKKHQSLQIINPSILRPQTAMINQNIETPQHNFQKSTKQIYFENDSSSSQQYFSNQKRIQSSRKFVSGHLGFKKPGNRPITAYIDQKSKQYEESPPKKQQSTQMIKMIPQSAFSNTQSQQTQPINRIQQSISSSQLDFFPQQKLQKPQVNYQLFDQMSSIPFSKNIQNFKGTPQQNIFSNINHLNQEKVVKQKKPKITIDQIESKFSKNGYPSLGQQFSQSIIFTEEQLNMLQLKSP